MHPPQINEKISFIWLLASFFVLIFMYVCMFLVWYLFEKYWEKSIPFFVGGIISFGLLLYFYQKPLYKIFYHQNGIPKIPILPSRTYSEKLWNLNRMASKIQFFSKKRYIFLLSGFFGAIMLYTWEVEMKAALQNCLLFVVITLPFHFYWKYLQKRKIEIEQEENEKSL